MVDMTIEYLGDLRCKLTHGPSKTEIITDAPVDNQGKGQSFSPSDLVASSLGACMITIMGIVARRHQIDLSGLTASVTKEMVTEPERRIGKITVTFQFARNHTEKEKTLLERAAMTCPVHKSLSHEIETPIYFKYPVGGG
ncbi:MAG: OsmC family protein [Candidatus Omnitrophica bacterium]|nr:OsmC family protein [Candidatus Omnitrophota bacterium]